MAPTTLFLAQLTCLIVAGLCVWRAKVRDHQRHDDNGRAQALAGSTTGPLWETVVLHAGPLVFVAIAIFLWSLSFAALVPLSLGNAFWLSLSTGALVAAPFALLPPIWRARAAGAFVLVVAFLVFADIVYWRFFDSLMPLNATQSAGLALDVTASIGAMLETHDVLLFTFVALGALVFLIRPSAPQREQWWMRGVAFVLLLLLAIPSIHDVNGWMGTRFSWKIFGWDKTVKHVGVAQAHVRDFARTFRESLRTEEIDDATVVKFADANAQTRADIPTKGGDLAGTNVVIVQLEAMQRWVIGAEIDGKAITPFLNLARQKGTFYSNVWDITGGSPTSDCEFAALNSQYPLAQGSVAFRRQGNTFVAVPKLLNDGGYATASGHANAPRMWNRGVVHPAWGFSTSWFRDEFSARPIYGWGLGDHTFFLESVDKMATLQQPFATFLISLTSHHPFRYVPPGHRAYRKMLRKPMGDYAGNMHYVDQSLVHLLEGLQKKGLLQSTSIVLYGDHDSKLKVSRGVANELKRKVGMSEVEARSIARRRWRTKKIPLFILSPSENVALLNAWKNGERAKPLADGRWPSDVAAVGSQVDIGATLLRRLGRPIPNSFVGKPLVADHHGIAAKADGSCVDGQRIYDAKMDTCTTFDAAAPLPLDDCDALRERCQATLTRSWSITLNDLSTKLNATKVDAPKTPRRQPHASDAGLDAVERVDALQAPGQMSDAGAAESL